VSNPPSGPPLNPYAVYEQQQAYLAAHPEARQQQQAPQAPPPPPGYLANGFPVPPQFASGRAQGQAERNIGKTVAFRLVVGTVAAVFVFGLLFAVGGVIALVSR